MAEVQLEETVYSVVEGEDNSVSVCAEVIVSTEEGCPIAFSFKVYLLVGDGMLDYTGLLQGSAQHNYTIIHYTNTGSLSGQTLKCFGH